MLQTHSPASWSVPSHCASHGQTVLRCGLGDLTAPYTIQVNARVAGAVPYSVRAFALVTAENGAGQGVASALARVRAPKSRPRPSHPPRAVVHRPPTVADPAIPAEPMTPMRPDPVPPESGMQPAAPAAPAAPAQPAAPAPVPPGPVQPGTPPTLPAASPSAALPQVAAEQASPSPKPPTARGAETTELTMLTPTGAMAAGKRSWATVVAVAVAGEAMLLWLAASLRMWRRGLVASPVGALRRGSRAVAMAPVRGARAVVTAPTRLGRSIAGGMSRMFR